MYLAASFDFVRNLHETHVLLRTPKEQDASQSTNAATAKSGLPKLWVRGAACSPVAVRHCCESGPAWSRDSRRKSYGPLYLLIEHAVEVVRAKLEAAPEAACRRWTRSR